VTRNRRFEQEQKLTERTTSMTGASPASFLA